MELRGTKNHRFEQTVSLRWYRYSLEALQVAARVQQFMAALLPLAKIIGLFL
jgi:hypothetical protein